MDILCLGQDIPDRENSFLLNPEKWKEGEFMNCLPRVSNNESLHLIAEKIYHFAECFTFEYYNQRIIGEIWH